jgi:hypothetical protein
MNIDEQLIELALRKHHLIDRADVASVMTSGQWCRLQEHGMWLPVVPGVWRHRATVVDWRLQARAGVRALGDKSALYGRTAAAWWDIGKLGVTDVEFVVPRTRRSRSLPFLVHTTSIWIPTDVQLNDGVRLTSATRTVIDLAAGATTAKEIEAVIDESVQKRLTSFPALSKRVGELCGRGFPGTERLRGLLLDSGGDSYLERRFLELVRTAGLPRPTCQVMHSLDGKRIARVDFQFPDTKIIVEVSGRLGHVSDRDRQRDARRRNGLQQTGHIVLEFTTADVLDEQGYVIETLTAQLSKGAAR